MTEPHVDRMKAVLRNLISYEEVLIPWRLFLRDCLTSIATTAKFMCLENVKVYSMLIVCQSVNTVQLVHVIPPVKIIGQKPDTILVVS